MAKGIIDWVDVKRRAITYAVLALPHAVILGVLGGTLDAWGVFKPFTFALGEWLKVNVTPQQAAWTVALAVVLLLYVVSVLLLGKRLRGGATAAAAKKMQQDDKPTVLRVLEPDTAIDQGLALIKERSSDNANIEGDLRDQLSLGSVHSWARPMVPGDNALEPIPAETWRKMTFQIMRPQGHRKPLSRIVPSATGWHQSIHYDLQLSSLEIDERWPPSNSAQRALNESEWLSLKQAAQIVYDRTRHSVLSRVLRTFARSSTNEILRETAETIWRHALSVRAVIPGAMTPDDIASETRDEFFVFDDISTVGRVALRPDYENVEVRRNSLPAVVEYINDLSV